MPTSHPLVGQPDSESLTTCPYNPSHRIAIKRMQFHLTKCRKGHPNAKKEVCPYNVTHMINEQEFQFHLEVCPSKGVVDNFRYNTSQDNHTIELPPPPVVPPSEENWDNDYCGTYEPAAKVAAAPIVFTFIGGTRSERKKCRVEQRQKFRALDETLPVVKNAPKITQEKPLADDQPLRQPKTLPKSLANDSARFASLNQSIASGISDVASTSKLQGNSLDDDKMPDLVAANAWVQNKSGPFQNGDDGFVVCKSKSRVKHRY